MSLLLMAIPRLHYQTTLQGPVHTRLSTLETPRAGDGSTRSRRRRRCATRSRSGRCDAQDRRLACAGAVGYAPSVPAGPTPPRRYALASLFGPGRDGMVSHTPHAAHLGI